MRHLKIVAVTLACVLLTGSLMAAALVHTQHEMGRVAGAALGTVIVLSRDTATTIVNRKSKGDRLDVRQDGEDLEDFLEHREIQRELVRR